MDGIYFIFPNKVTGYFDKYEVRQIVYAHRTICACVSKLHRNGRKEIDLQNPWNTWFSFAKKGNVLCAEKSNNTGISQKVLSLV